MSLSKSSGALTCTTGQLRFSSLGILSGRKAGKQATNGPGSILGDASCQTLACQHKHGAALAGDASQNSRLTCPPNTLKDTLPKGVQEAHCT